MSEGSYQGYPKQLFLLFQLLNSNLSEPKTQTAFVHSLPRSYRLAQPLTLTLPLPDYTVHSFLRKNKLQMQVNSQMGPPESVKVVHYFSWKGL